MRERLAARHGRAQELGLRRVTAAAGTRAPSFGAQTHPSRSFPPQGSTPSCGRYITSDCDADNDVVFSHHYTKTPEEGVAAVLHAGTDVDCGGFVSKYAQSALDKGTITEGDLDARLKDRTRAPSLSEQTSP